MKARRLCRLASKYNKNWGAPYLLIGAMYASSSKQCSQSEASSLDSKAVVWVAIDEWRKAQKVDASTKEEAMLNIKKYKAYLPLESQAFVYNLKQGDRYVVGCWIKQATTVRVRRE